MVQLPELMERRQPLADYLADERFGDETWLYHRQHAKSLGKNGSNGSSNWFVIEADEYDYMFFGLYPEITILTGLA